MYDHYWNGCDAHSLLRQAILRRFQVLHNCFAYDGAGMLTRLRFWDHQISRLRPHGSVGRSGCLPYLFYLLDVDGILGGYIGVISACTVFIEWALGRDTLHGVMGFIGFGAINPPIWASPPLTFTRHLRNLFCHSSQSIFLGTDHEGCSGPTLHVVTVW
jgi:hypothetical protein